MSNTENNEQEVLSYRCQKCNKLFGKEALGSGDLEIKCLRCGEINTVFRKMKEQVIITDPDGKILFVNNALEHVTGYRLDEVIGQTPRVWGGQMPQEFYKELWRIIKTEKKAAVAKLTNRHKSGRLYDVILRISPVKDGTNKIIFFVGIEAPLDKNTKAKEGWSMPEVGN